MSMNKVKVTVEGMFGQIATYFAFLDYKKNLKIQLSVVGKMYTVCALQQMPILACTKMKLPLFNIDPPPLLEYCFVLYKKVFLECSL